jgi:DNA-binding transcriptional MerR regulator
MKYYGINSVAKTTGITESTLRRWEAMGYFDSDRVELGNTQIRIYLDEHLDVLQRAKNLIDDGMRVRVAFDFLNGHA